MKITQNQIHQFIIKKQAFFLSYDFEDAVLRYDPTTGAMFVKFKGKPEFKALKGSAIVTEAMMEGNSITEKQYQDF